MIINQIKEFQCLLATQKPLLSTDHPTAHVEQFPLTFQNTHSS